MIHIGCSGFPVAQAKYFRRFSAVEIASTFQRLPRRSTLERWRRELPADAVISVCAWQPLTHPCTNASLPRIRPALSRRRMLRYGHFHAAPEVREAWLRFDEVLEVLRPRFILFRTPATFHPGADHLRDMYRFFKDMRRREAAPVWMPAGAAWNERLVGKVCGDLGLLHGVDPLRGRSVLDGMRYFRLAGRERFDRGCRYTDEELAQVAARCAGKPTFVFFDTNAMWRDAQRLQALVDRGGR